MNVKTRFAPSPSGLLHLGNLRTALFNALFAYHHQGVFLLRIEDTDAERSRDEYIAQLQHDLQWLGLAWQEGPQIGGKAGPYQQSERSDIYHHYYNQLEQQGQAYRCFCTPRELEISRKLQRVSGQAPRYAGTCAHLSADEVQAKLAQGLQSTLRFRVPRGEVQQFTDLVRGEQRFNGDDIGDFIIRRADGSPAFFFCNAVDDALMDVTHVLRGEDHLTNTPRQLWILQALGLRCPHYAHISMIVGEDNTPLSKRHGSQSLVDLRAAGWLPSGILNYLARLGHSYTNDAFMSLTELAQHFDLARLGRAPARFDAQQMQHWQHAAVSEVETDTLWAWQSADTQALVPIELRELFLQAVRPNLLFPADGLEWAQRLFHDVLRYDDDARHEMIQAGTEFFAHARAALEDSGGEWKTLAQTLKNRSGRKGKALFMPLRAALTGVLHGPEMSLLLPLIGMARAHARLNLNVLE